MRVNLEQIEALERLAELKRQGILTDAEVETEKNRILSAGPAPAGDAADEDESHRPEVDQPAPPPEHPEADLQPPVIEEHNVDEQPLEPEAEDSQSSSRGDTRKTTSTQTIAEDSRTTTAAQARARFEKRQKKRQSKKRRRTLIGALALIAIAVISAVTITNRDSNPSTGLDMSPAAIKDRVDAVATSTTAGLDKGLVPEFAQVDTYLGDNGRTLEVYLALSDVNDNPLRSVHGANLELTLSDLRGNELYKDEFVLRSRDFTTWTWSQFGNKTDKAGFKIEIPTADIERSLTGSRGTIGYHLDFGTGVYWDYEDDTGDLPEASEAEQGAADIRAFLKSATEFSQDFAKDNLAIVRDPFGREKGWFVIPKRAGCYELFDSRGNIEPGIRVDLEISNLSKDVESFYMDGLLQISNGLPIEASYQSTLRGMTVPGDQDKDGGEWFEGYFFFEDVACDAAEYRFMFSDHTGTHMDISFYLR
jgi:hypothetical protein